MKRSICVTFAVFSVFSLLCCKNKNDVPPEPIIPSVMLSGDFFTQDEQGNMIVAFQAEQGQSVLAYPESDKDKNDEKENSYQIIFFDEKNYWVLKDNLVQNASPVVLVDEMPFSQTENADSTDTETRIPTGTIIAVHHTGMWLDYLQVSYLADSEDASARTLRTGFIPNPHPFFSAQADDIAGMRLYQKARALPPEEKETKKSLLDAALSLENLSPKVRAMIQAERTALEPPPAPKPNVSYERVRIPTSLQGGSKSRYGVNMTELLKGGTEDPWAKKSK
ncbi:MAG: hypothetical protein IJS09_02780 [Treponema sp.]|nr:hypothetical protein [Treponema sp.]